MPDPNHPHLEFELKPRVSFRTWLVLWCVVLVAVGLAMPWIKAKWDWERFRSDVAAQGGSLHRFQGHVWEEPHVSCWLHGDQQFQFDLSGIDWSEKVHELAIRRVILEDKELAFLERLEGLKYLELSQTTVTDGAAKHLQNITTLERLQMNWCRIGDDTIRAVAKLPRLESLHVAGTYVTEESLEILDQHPTIRSLTLPSMDYAKFNEFRAANPQMDAKAVSLPGQIPVLNGPPINYPRRNGLSVGPPPGPNAGAKPNP